MAKLKISLLLLIFIVSGCKLSQSILSSDLENIQFAERPKNIVLLIGDGMGLTQISAALYANNNKHLLEFFPIIGFQKTHASNDLITDSAAGATAIACGKKTYNNAIGIDADSLVCTSILEKAEAAGLATGLIATSSITHATPASFIAHQYSRAFNENIAADFLKVDIDLFIGGGKKYFDRRDIDDRDLIKELKAKGYYVGDYFQRSFQNVKANPAKKFAFFTADSKPLSALQGRNYLPLATERAMEFLTERSDKGFFLMAEGSQIDWAGHANQGFEILTEMNDFENTIGKVLHFAAQNKETLVIVTADHETGGLAINPGSKMKKLKMEFTTNNHTATMVPVFAFGPKADLFSGIYDNTEIFYKMMEALGLE